MSDSPTSPSGFGNVTRFICGGLASRGHQVSILGWQTTGSPARWQGCALYPVRLSTFGADVLLNYLQKIQPDVLITLADVWWLTYIANPVIANFMRAAQMPWALYFPIDGDMGEGRLPPSWVRILRTVDLPIAMSQYGRDVSRANGVDPAYVPHGVELDAFRPPADKEAAKAALGYQGRFVVLSDARNQPRKLLPRTLDIFRRFAAGKPDALLHLHCDPHDPAARTREYFYDLQEDIRFLGLGDEVRLTAGMSIGAGLSLDRLAALYQAADVHLLSSWGEGFGLPTLQAAAAGVVPMASDYTASRELVLGHGEAIRVGRQLLDHFGIRRALIDVEDAVARLEGLYRDPARLRAKSLASRAFAEGYGWSDLVGRWDALLRAEVPRLRRTARAAPSTVRFTVGAGAARPLALTRTVNAVLPDLPDGAQVTMKVLESKAGELGVEVMRDAAAWEHRITIPVTLAPHDPTLVKARVPGCVFLASAEDAPVVRRLSRIFPGLNAWSTAPFDMGPAIDDGRPVAVKVVPPGTRDFDQHLAASGLALDLGGRFPELPALAAAAGVPWLGPATRDPAGLGRTLLTDQGAAEAYQSQAGAG